MMLHVALLPTVLATAAHAFALPTRHGPIEEPVWQCPGTMEPVLSVGVSEAYATTLKGCAELRRSMVLVANNDWLYISVGERALVDACPWQVCADVVRPEGPYDFPRQRSVGCFGPEGQWTLPAAATPASAEPAPAPAPPPAPATD